MSLLMALCVTLLLKQVSPPAGDASIFRSLLVWIYPLAYRGYKRPLVENDIPEILPFHRAAACVKLGEQYVRRQQRNGARVSTYGICWAIGKCPLVAGCLIAITQGVVSTAARAYVLRMSVSTLTNEDATSGEAVLLIVVFILVVLFEGLLSHLARYYISLDFANIFVAAVSTLLVKKSLLVAPVTSGGQESSLLGNDILRTAENFANFSQFPGSVAGVVSGAVTLYLLLGVAGLVGLLVMTVILVLNRQLAVASKGLTLTLTLTPNPNPNPNWQSPPLA
jgi:hypothetical protein